MVLNCISKMENLSDMGNVFSGVSSETPAPIHGTTHVNHGEKLEKFSGLNFKRWQQKMVFYLTTLGLVKYLTEEPPSKDDGDEDLDFIKTRDSWSHNEFLCRHHVINCLSDSLYDVYSAKTSAKELWEGLDRKYRT